MLKMRKLEIKVLTVKKNLSSKPRAITYLEKVSNVLEPTPHFVCKTRERRVNANSGFQATTNDVIVPKTES